MSETRRLGGFTPVHLLVLVAVAELSITRLAVPTLLPKPKEAIPFWYTALDNFGLFLQYFATTLALGILGVRAWNLIQTRRPVEIVFGAALGACALLAAVNAVLTPTGALSFAFQTAWAIAILQILVATMLHRDYAIRFGVLAFAVPLLAHYTAVFLGYCVMSEDEVFDTLLDRARTWGLFSMVCAALVSPYCLSPRPAIRSIGKIGPIVVALLIGGLGAVLVRRQYAAAMDLSRLGVGVDLMPGVSNNDMALYLLALATLAWTFTACAIAETESRREIGMGLGLVVLGGYGFVWPVHFLFGVVGLLVIYDASARVRDEEAPRGVRPRTPSIGDEHWQSWIGQLSEALRDGGGDLRTVTVRGEGETTQSVIVGERHGVPFKARFGRLGGALVAIDVIAGREVAETQRATFTLYARPDGREAHPQPPPAAPAVQLDDTAFMQRFRIRGEADAVTALFDDALRAKAAAILDGWLAFWTGQGVRWRVYPAVGAPLDHPVPIADLAMKGTGGVDRMVGVIDLLTSAAARGLEGVTHEPAVLE